jgi:hypothetical protein
MTTHQMRNAIRGAPYSQEDQSDVFAIDEFGQIYAVENVAVADNGSIIFVLSVRYDKETCGRDRIYSALAATGIEVRQIKTPHDNQPTH